MAALEGVITAMATPFEEDGAVDEAAARRLARHLLENGSHGLVVAGTTGESPTLDDTEHISLLRAILDEVGGEATVVCGTGTNDTRHSRELTTAAVEAGADAVLVVTPYYNKPNPAGIKAHFASVAEAAGAKPVIAYNIPSRCVVNISPALLAEMASEIENLVAVKQANDDELAPIEGLEILAGNDNVLYRCLDFGGAGGITVASNLIGNEMRAIYDAAKGGDLERAKELDEELQPFYEALAVTSNPIPVKAGLEMLGLASGRLRLPMVEADEAQRATVRKALEARGLLAASAR